MGEIPPERCDIVVVGGGPAASIASFRLADLGLEVVQFTGKPERGARPAEIVSPLARRVLRSIGLDGAANLGVPCSGVLSSWEQTEPNYLDMYLMKALDGRCVDRFDFHQELLRSGVRAGVKKVDLKVAFNASDGISSWWLQDGQKGEIQARWTFIATGRSALLPWAPSARKRSDRLIAIAAPWIRDARPCDLVIESLEHGWWYAPPLLSAGGWIVFVTDVDRIPYSRDQRASFLGTLFQNSPLIRKLGPRPDFRRLHGVDAHAGYSSQLVWGTAAVIGDAAMSLDPLAGAGIAHAVEGACVAAYELVRSGRVGPEYDQWCAERSAEIRRESTRHYKGALRRFPESAFWQERCNAAREGLALVSPDRIS